MRETGTSREGSGEGQSREGSGEGQSEDSESSTVTGVLPFSKFGDWRVWFSQQIALLNKCEDMGQNPRAFIFTLTTLSTYKGTHITLTHKHTHINTPAHTYSVTHSYTNTLTFTLIHTNTHTLKHKHIHTQIHMHAQ